MKSRWVWVWVLLWTGWMSAQESGLDSRHFLYVSNQRIVTVELSDDTSVILNYINLSDNFELIESTNLLVVDSRGQNYRSHLIRMEERDEEGHLFQVTDLIEPRRFAGYEVMGNFRYQAPPRAVYLRLGARILALDPLTSEDFDRVSERIDRLDLSVSNSSLAVLDAGFWQGMGTLFSVGTPEGEAINNLLPELETFPPILLANPAPRLMSKFHHFPDPVLVRVRVRVTAQGGMIEPEIETGLDEELDAIALEVVRNSWDLLPAISEGKPAGAELVLRIVFQR